MNFLTVEVLAIPKSSLGGYGRYFHSTTAVDILPEDNSSIAMPNSSSGKSTTDVEEKYSTGEVSPEDNSSIGVSSLLQVKVLQLRTFYLKTTLLQVKVLQFIYKTSAEKESD